MFHFRPSVPRPPYCHDPPTAHPHHRVRRGVAGGGAGRCVCRRQLGELDQRTRENRFELAVGERVFARLLDQNRERLAQAARVMAADYALRGAIASGDQDTVVSALTNHGGRIKADMTLLVSLGSPRRRRYHREQRAGSLFEFPQLIDRAAREGGASSIEAINGRAYQLVVVPVLAPTPMAWISVGFVIDDNVVSELQQLHVAAGVLPGAT